MTAGLMTAEQMLALNIRDKRAELVRGRLVVREPAGFRHGVLAAEVARRLGNFVVEANLGLVIAAETGFKLVTGPDTVRAPDAAFIVGDRVPSPLPHGYPAIAPDLAVEVLSPDDRPGQVLAKVADWITAGTRLVWVLDPDSRQARVYRADGSQILLEATQSLDGEDVLPGFTCRVGELVS